MAREAVTRGMPATRRPQLELLPLLLAIAFGGAPACGHEASAAITTSPAAHPEEKPAGPGAPKILTAADYVVMKLEILCPNSGIQCAASVSDITGEPFVLVFMTANSSRSDDDAAREVVMYFLTEFRQLPWARTLVIRQSLHNGASRAARVSTNQNDHSTTTYENVLGRISWLNFADRAGAQHVDDVGIPLSSPWMN